MPGPAALPLVLRRRERRILEAAVRCSTAAHALVVRARIVLLAADGRSNAEIGRRVGCEPKTARKWRARYAAHPTIDALRDDMRVGRPPTIPSVARLELVKLACLRPADCKAPFRAVWTGDSLREALEVVAGFRMSTSEVRRILRDENIRPHRVRMWLHSPDPDFARKVRPICALYLAPPGPNEVVLCIDEKTGMQALERRHPSRSPRRGHAGRFEFEYRRRGTRTLFAAFNPHTGEVFGQCSRRRKATDLLRFMEDVARQYPEKKVTVIWDNLNIHKPANWVEFNRRHGGRFHFLYTPLHASWVNQVEIWFSIFARRVLRYASFASIAELTHAVRGFIARWNTHEAHPFRWTFRGTFRQAAA